MFNKLAVKTNNNASALYVLSRNASGTNLAPARGAGRLSDANDCSRTSSLFLIIQSRASRSTAPSTSSASSASASGSAPSLAREDSRIVLTLWGGSVDMLEPALIRILHTLQTKCWSNFGLVKNGQNAYKGNVFPATEDLEKTLMDEDDVWGRLDEKLCQMFIKYPLGMWETYEIATCDYNELISASDPHYECMTSRLEMLLGFSATLLDDCQAIYLAAKTQDELDKWFAKKNMQCIGEDSLFEEKEYLKKKLRNMGITDSGTWRSSSLWNQEFVKSKITEFNSINIENWSGLIAHWVENGENVFEKMPLRIHARKELQACDEEPPEDFSAFIKRIMDQFLEGLPTEKLDLQNSLAEVKKTVDQKDLVRWNQLVKKKKEFIKTYGSQMKGELKESRKKSEALMAKVANNAKPRYDVLPPSSEAQFKAAVKAGDVPTMMGLFGANEDDLRALQTETMQARQVKNMLMCFIDVIGYQVPTTLMPMLNEISEVLGDQTVYIKPDEEMVEIAKLENVTLEKDQEIKFLRFDISDWEEKLIVKMLPGKQVCSFNIKTLARVLDAKEGPLKKFHQRLNEYIKHEEIRLQMEFRSNAFGVCNAGQAPSMASLNNPRPCKRKAEDVEGVRAGKAEEPH